MDSEKRQVNPETGEIVERQTANALAMPERSGRPAWASEFDPEEILAGLANQAATAFAPAWVGSEHVGQVLFGRVLRVWEVPTDYGTARFLGVEDRDGQVWGLGLFGEVLRRALGDAAEGDFISACYMGQGQTRSGRPLNQWVAKIHSNVRLSPAAQDAEDPFPGAR